MARAGGKDRGLFQKNGVWWVRWTCSYGHEHRERGGSKSVARQLYQQRKTAVRYDNFCLSAARAKVQRDRLQTFNSMAERYMEWAVEHCPRSLRFYRTIVRQVTAEFGARPMGEITTQDVEKYLKSRLEGGSKPATVNRSRAVLSHMFTMASKWGLVEHNPVSDTEARKENNIAPRPLTEEEERRVFAIMPQSRREIAVFAINTGMRLGELRAQRWSDVDMDAGVLTVTLPKSGKHEVIPLNSAALSVLASAERSSELVFPHIPRSMSTVFVRYVKLAGLEGITFHCLRDTFISRLAVSASPATMMALARHRNFRTTQRYLKLDDNHLRQAVESIVSAQNGAPIGTLSGTEVLEAV